MGAHILDSIFLKDLYGTGAMRAVFDDLGLLQRWLDVEVALARAEADIGLIPVQAAEAIAACARAERLDTARIKALIDETVHPIVPMIRVLAETCGGEAGAYVHWGATTQDIMDTANVLQMKDAINILEGNLRSLSETLRSLADRHRDTLMAGRTHGQHALPITFGFKAAVWLEEVQRHIGRLEQCRPRVLVGQFGGAVGTLASVEEHGLEIQRRMMAQLELGVTRIPWHTARDGVAELICHLRDDRRHSRQDRPGDQRASKDGARGGRRTLSRGEDRLKYHAAQAQPDALRSRHWSGETGGDFGPGLAGSHDPRART